MPTLADISRLSTEEAGLVRPHCNRTRLSPSQGRVVNGNPCSAARIRACAGGGC